jgi:hypothetical protein
MSKSKEQTRKSPPKIRVIDNKKQYLGPPISKIIVVHASKFAKEMAASRKVGGKRRKTQKRRRTQKK